MTHSASCWESSEAAAAAGYPAAAGPGGGPRGLGQPHHLVEAHGPRHPLQRVGGTENLVDDVHIDHVLLQGQQEVVQLLKVVVRLIQESAKVLAHVHIRHDLPSPNS